MEVASNGQHIPVWALDVDLSLLVRRHVPVGGPQSLGARACKMRVIMEPTARRRVGLRNNWGRGPAKQLAHGGCTECSSADDLPFYLAAGSGGLRTGLRDPRPRWAN